MKNFPLLFIAIMAGLSLSHGATTPVTNSNLTFSPATVNITTNDTLSFTLASIHNAQEVSLATYNANQTTALSGGFLVPFGASASKLSGLTAGTHYYVCMNHAGSGMKGQIIVQAVSATSPAFKNLNSFTFQIAGSKPIAFAMPGETVRISIVNMMGKTVWSTTFAKDDIRNLYWDRKLADGSNLAAGIYFVQSTALDVAQKPIGQMSRSFLQIH